MAKSKKRLGEDKGNVYTGTNGIGYSQNEIGRMSKTPEFQNWAKANPTGNIYQYISGQSPTSAGPTPTTQQPTAPAPTQTPVNTTNPGQNTTTGPSLSNNIQTGNQSLYGTLPNEMIPQNLNNPYQYNMGNMESLYSNLMSQATQGTTDQFNTAANRLRERIDSSTAGQSDRARNQSLSRGFGSSGINDAAQFRVQQAGQNAYAQGLSDLEGQFGQLRQQGLNTALGAAQGLGGMYQNLNEANLNDLSGRRGFYNDYANRGAGLYTGAQQRASQEGMQREQIASNEKLAKEGYKLQEKSLNNNDLMAIANLLGRYSP